MDFLMESGFMHWMSEKMSFTNWVKADFHETSRITLKFLESPRLRERYRLGAGSLYKCRLALGLGRDHRDNRDNRDGLRVSVIPFWR